VNQTLLTIEFMDVIIHEFVIFYEKVRHTPLRLQLWKDLYEESVCVFLRVMQSEGSSSHEAVAFIFSLRDPTLDSFLTFTYFVFFTIFSAFMFILASKLFCERYKRELMNYGES
jgi:hypothetical protein